MSEYKPILDRFVEKIQLDTKTGCWNWTGTISRNGYGRMNIRGKTIEAHRVSFQLFKGEIPKGLEIDHECRNRKCENPNHLRAITHRENTDHDRRKTHCDAGHPYIPGSYHQYKTKHGVGRWCKQCFRLRRAIKEGRDVSELGTRDKPRERTHCKNGHCFAEVGFYIQKANGKAYRKCKACQDAWNKNWNHIRRIARAKNVSPSMALNR